MASKKTEIPKHELQALARAFADDIVAFFESEEGKREYNVPSPKKQTKNVREKPNEKNDKYNMKLLYPTVFIPRFA